MEPREPARMPLTEALDAIMRSPQIEDGWFHQHFQVWEWLCWQEAVRHHWPAEQPARVA